MLHHVAASAEVTVLSPQCLRFPFPPLQCLLAVCTTVLRVGHAHFARSRSPPCTVCCSAAAALLSARLISSLSADGL
eukprot:3683330-Pyramimonas_sp.AAC.1